MKKKFKDCTMEELINGDWNFCKDESDNWKCRQGCPFMIFGTRMCSRRAFINIAFTMLEREIELSEE